MPNNYNHGYGTAIITAERLRQIYDEGWTPEHDDKYKEAELTNAAIAYAIAPRERYNGGDPPYMWPWEESWWKPSPHDRIAELAKSGALIAAEIDGLIRSGYNSSKWGHLINKVP